MILQTSIESEQFRKAHFPVRKDGTPVGTADMSGWDTIYAVRASVINAALRKHFEARSADEALHLDIKVESELYDVTVDARFGAWQVGKGGAGNRIRLEMPLTGGNAVIKARTDRTIDLTGTAVIAEVTLGFHRPPELSVDEPLIAQLKIVTEHHAPQLTSAAQLRNPGTRKTASDDRVDVIDLVGLAAIGGSQASLDGIRSAVKTAIQQWLSDNIAIFDYVFLSVDIAEEADTGDFAWIKPTTVGYAVTDVLDNNQNVKDTIFGVLSMTQGGSPDGAVLQISASSIPVDPGVNAAFLISPHLVIQKLLQPQIHTLFHDARPMDFARSDDGMTIQNIADIFLPLHLEPEFLSFAEKDVKGKISRGNFFMTTQDFGIRTAFRNVTVAYGTDNEVDLQLTYDATSAVGLDKNDHFAMQLVGQADAHVAAQPNQEKISGGIYTTIGGAILAQIAVALIFRGIGAGFSRLSKVLGKVGKVGAALGEDTAAVRSEVEMLARSEVTAAEQVGEKGVVKAVSPANPSVWTMAKSAATRGGMGVCDFLSGVMNNNITFLIAGQALGSLWGERSQIDTLSALHEHPERMPTMAHFATNCISPVVWPKTGHATLLSAGLNYAFTLGLQIEEE
jgi:hypothetical protein